MKALELLKKHFSEAHKNLLDKDTVFVFVSYKSTFENDNEYGRFTTIKRDWLCGREYELRVDTRNRFCIRVLDAKYNPQLRQHEMNLNPNL